MATAGEWLWLISQQDSIYQMSKERGSVVREEEKEREADDDLLHHFCSRNEFAEMEGMDTPLSH